MSIARPLSQESTMIEFEGKAKSPLNAIMVYTSIVLAIGFAVYIFLMDNSLKNQISSIKTEQDMVDADLAKPEYADVIGESKAFELAVSNLGALSAKRVSKAEMLTELYKYITKDVRIASISLSDAGDLGISGYTGSYRSTADFVVGLRSFKKASNVKLVSVSLSPSEGSAANEKFMFNVTAKLDMTKAEVPAETVIDTTAETTEASSGSTVDTTESSSSGDAATADQTTDTTTITPTADDLQNNSLGY